MEYQLGLIRALDYAQGVDSRAGLADAQAKAVNVRSSGRSGPRADRSWARFTTAQDLSQWPLTPADGAQVRAIWFGDGQRDAPYFVMSFTARGGAATSPR